MSTGGCRVAHCVRDVIEDAAGDGPIVGEGNLRGGAVGAEDDHGIRVVLEAHPRCRDIVRHYEIDALPGELAGRVGPPVVGLGRESDAALTGAAVRPPLGTPVHGRPATSLRPPTYIPHLSRRSVYLPDVPSG